MTQINNLPFLHHAHPRDESSETILGTLYFGHLNGWSLRQNNIIMPSRLVAAALD